MDNPKEARSFVDVLGKLRVWGRKNSDVERTALNEDQAFQEEVRNVARALGNAVNAPDPDASPTPKVNLNH